MPPTRNRIDRHPMLVNLNRKGESLKRIRIDELLVKEKWIQHLIRENPKLIPMEPDHRTFSPLIPIGFELTTPVGRLDNLFISPSGHLTVVEAKLYRNSEARRGVVGQILEYAAHLKGWSYEQLDHVTREYNRKYNGEPRSLFETVTSHPDADEEDEAVFADAVTRSLSKGRFLLVVLGDGIRESLEDMVELIHGQPGVQFSLSLVELQLFETQEGRRLVVPSLVGRTVEVERAVVRIVNLAENATKATIEATTEQKPSKPGSTGTRYTLGESEFFEHLSEHSDPSVANAARKVYEDAQALGCIVEWKQSSFAVKLPNLASNGPPFSLLVIYKQNAVSVRSLAGQLVDAGLDRQIAVDYVAEAAKLFNNLEFVINDNKPTYFSRPVSILELAEKWDEFKEVLKRTIVKISEEVEAASDSYDD